MRLFLLILMLGVDDGMHSDTIPPAGQVLYSVVHNWECPTAESLGN